MTIKLSIKQKKILREFVNYTCENCRRHEKDCGKLEAHRIKQGGEYSLRNILMCCNTCHRIFSSAQNKAMRISN